MPLIPASLRGRRGTAALPWPPVLAAAPRLAQLVEGRDNNLNLIRMAAALAVLVSHAWPLTLGPGAAQPLSRLLGVELGTAAVYVFFALSGLLVARSFERQPSVRRFVLARALRILPGLAVVLIAIAFVLGPALTELSLAAYLSDPETWLFVPRGLGLVHRQPTVPGLFGQVPYPGDADGSLWTLLYEVACYAGVLLLGLAGIFERPGRRAAAALAAGAAWVAMPVLNPNSPFLWGLWSLGPPFALGVAFWCLRRRLPLSPWLGLALAVVALAARDWPGGRLLAVAALAYGVILLGYLPGGAIRLYNRLGDYSYGVYIYAWPVQQAVAQLLRPEHPLGQIAVALPVTLVLAWASWRWVEAPALRLRPDRARGTPARSG